MADPRQQLVTFPLNLGMDNVSYDESVQPFGERPALVESRNTRLSKVPGLVSKAPGCTALTGTLAAPCGGIVPCGAVDSSLAFFQQGVGAKRVVGSQQSALVGAFGAAQQGGMWPGQVVQAGSLPGGKRYAPSSCYDAANGVTWFAGMVQYDANSYAIVVSAFDSSGALRVANTMLVGRGLAFGHASTILGWVGLSAHGSNGAYLWYREAPGTSIVVARLQLSGQTATLGTPTTVYTPTAATVIALAYDTADTENAYLVTHGSASTSVIAVHRVVIPTLVCTNYTIATAAAVSSVAAAYVKQGASSYLVVAQANSTPASVIYSMNVNVTSGALWSSAGAAADAPIALGLYQAAGGTIYVCSAHEVAGSGSGIQSTHLSVYFKDQPTGATYATSSIPWRCLSARNGATHKISTTEMAPHFLVRPTYNTGVSYDTSSAAFVGDPDVELFRPLLLSSTSVQMACVAKLGSDLAVRASATLSSNPLAFEGDRCTLTYLAENVVDGIANNAWGYVARYAVVDFGAQQPRYAITSDGTAIIAGALTGAWDGATYTEYSPMVAPKVTTSVVGAGLWPAGTYQIAAVLQWKDAQGQLHRSAPSAVITWTTAGAEQPEFSVTIPASYRDGLRSEGVRPVVYCSLANGSVLYAQNYDVSFVATYFSQLGLPTPPVQDAWHPALYSDGSATMPLSSMCPNASRDVAVISDRVWFVDAELPARAYFTAPKENGVFPTFNPELYVDLPSSAGQLIAVTSFNDAPLFLTSTGVWSVAGDGPDALNSPPYFAAPQQISTVACTQRSSVVTTPAGVLFVSNNRFALFNGQVSEFPNIVAPTVVGTAVFRKYHEVAFFTSSGLAYVFNWQANAWSVWHTDALGAGASVTACAQVPSTGAVLLYSATNQALRILDPDTVSTTAQIRLETGWALLGGPQDDNVVHNLVLHGKYGGAHGMEMVISTDYGAAQPTKDYSLADTLNASLNTRYDLFPEPRDMSARALKVVLQETDAAGEAFQPANLTVEFAKTQGRLHKNLRRSGRK